MAKRQITDTDKYKFVCSLLWGCVPVDREWAESTDIFIKNCPLILEQYPELNKSFFNL